jgi:hypothetical protein
VLLLALQKALLLRVLVLLEA